jgi:hypothetical protein
MYSSTKIAHAISTFLERLMPNKSAVLPFLEFGDLSVDTWVRVVVAQKTEWGSKDGGISEWMVWLLKLMSRNS